MINRLCLFAVIIFMTDGRILKYPQANTVIVEDNVLEIQYRVPANKPWYRSTIIADINLARVDHWETSIDSQ